MGQFWLVLANSSRARFFEGVSPLAELAEIHDMQNAIVRAREQDLVSDRPGRRPDEGYAQRSGMERDAMDAEVTNFAREIVQYLEHGRATGQFTSLSIAAEPQFLGKLRSEMSSSLRGMVLEEVAKNLTDRGPEAVQDQLNVLR